jgi:hypothetical protein
MKFILIRMELYCIKIISVSINLFSSLSRDRSEASSKANCLHSAI